MVEVEGDGVASLCVFECPCEIVHLGGALGGFIYAAS
jgi:hypothetical protein